jgi:hypothetical protein
MTDKKRLVAILHENDKPIRAFVEKSCINSAYVWAHRHFCLSDYDPKLLPHQLPDWLKVTLHLMTTEQLNELIGGS